MNAFIDWVFLSLWNFYVVHGVISLLIALIGAWFLNRHYKDQFFRYVMIVFVFNIALPVIGYILSIWLVYYLLNVQYRTELSNVDYIDMFEFENEFPQIQRVFGEASIGDLLHNEDALSSLKMKAIVSLSDNVSKRNVMLIKENMSNKSDEIRLFSFAIIDDMERGINGKIHDLLQEFQAAEDQSMKVKLAEQLSFLYWELVYFELSDEVLQKFVLQEVKKYASIVLESTPDHKKINLLLGKVYLKEEAYEEAEEKLEKVISLTDERDYIIPYLAEIYFNKREFGKLKSLGSAFKNMESLMMNETLYPVIEQWKRV
jgi:tetratricopeptide (TPR) repeat protein